MHQDVFISMVRGIQGIAASSLAVASGSMIWGSSQSEKSDDRGCLNYPWFVEGVSVFCLHKRQREKHETADIRLDPSLTWLRVA